VREDARWHDGIPVTAHDIAFTLNLWKNPEVEHWAAAGVESATALDDHTVRIVYERPSKEPLNGWDVFYPKHLLERLDPKEFWEWEFWTRPVGSGPYRYVSHVPKSMTAFEANPSYYRGKPRLERMILQWGGNSVTELLGGSVNAAFVDPDDAKRLSRDPRFRIYYELNHGSTRIHWNHENPLFGDTVVRRALTMAIDRRELWRALGLPDTLSITDGIYTSCQFARGELTAPWPHDPEAAARLLAEAGWHDLDGDGVRDRDGQPFAFTLLAPTPWPQWGMEAAVFIQQQLRQVGIRMEVQQLDGPTVAERVRAGDFDAAIWLTPVEWFGQDSPMGYKNPRVARLLAAADSTVEQEEQDQIYRELAAIIHQDVPSTFLYPGIDFYAVRKEIRGFDPGRTGNLFFNLERLWWEE
jgi:peptide/nickel transport system substrate-binding protein